MSTSTATTFGWLVRREYWESRRGFLWAPFWGGASILILTVLGMLLGEVWNARSHGEAHVQFGISLDQMLRGVSVHDMPELVHGLDMTMLSIAVIAGIVLSFVVFFYLLGALYDDRRDRSILFWKSLPVSDTATVLSKVIAAVIVAPLIAVAIVLLTYIVLQVLVSLWLLIHGVDPFPLLWAHAEPFGVWLQLLVAIPVNAIWALPTVGWLLFWSAAARGKPFLWALLVPVVAGVLNTWVGLLGIPHIDQGFYWRELFCGALLSDIPFGWLPLVGGGHLSPHTMPADFGYAAMARALALPQMWIGAAAGIVLIAAAIWCRRWRDDS